MLPGNDNEIRFTFVLDAKKVLEDTDKFRQQVDQIKQQMAELQDQSGKTFREIQRGIEAQIRAQKAAKPIATVDPNTGERTSKTELAAKIAAWKEAQKELMQYQAAVKKATAELITEEKQLTGAIQGTTAARVESRKVSQSQIQEAKVYVQNARDIAKQERDLTLSRISSDRQRTEVAKQMAEQAKQAWVTAIGEMTKAEKQLEAARTKQSTAPSAANEQVVKAAQAAYDAAKLNVDAMRSISTDAAQHARAVEQGAQRMATSFFKVGNALRTVFTGALAFQVYIFFQNVIQYIKQSAEEAIKFQRNLFELALAFREMKRQGLEASFSDIQKMIAEVQKSFAGMFAESDVQNAFTTATSKLARFGLSLEEVNKIVKIGGTLALQFTDQFSGIEDAVGAIATYLASGKSQALQNASLIVGRGADELIEKNMKLEKSFESLSSAEQAKLRLDFLYLQSEGMIADVTEAATQAFGQMYEAQKRAADAQKTFGAAFAPFLVAWYEGWAGIVEFLANYVEPAVEEFVVFIGRTIAGMVGLLTYNIGVMVKTLQILKEDGFAAAQDFYGSFAMATAEGFQRTNEAISKGADQAEEQIRKMFADVKGEAIREFADKGVEINPSDLFDMDESKLKEFWSKLYKQVAELIRDYTRDLAEAERDKNRRLEEIDREYTQKGEDIWRDYYDRLKELYISYLQDVEDENRRYQYDIQDTERQFREKLEDAQREYREGEIEAEEEFQKRLRRLREDFLFDLDDAVRERDARQIMNLVKRYKVDRERLIEDFEDQKEERRKDFERQLEEIRRWRERRLAELAIEHARRLEELKRQYEREREEAAINRDRELEERERWRQEEREEAERDYQEKLDELKAHFEDRLQEILTSLYAEYDIQKEVADKIAQKLKEVFGKGGKAEKSYKDFMELLDEVNAKALESAAIIKELDELMGLTDGESDSSTEPSKDKKKADKPDWRSSWDETPTWSGGWDAQDSGGSTTPTSLAPLAPTSGIIGGVTSPLSASPATPTPMSGKSSMTLDVRLSEGLEADIVDKSLAEMIDVITSVRK